MSPATTVFTVLVSGVLIAATIAGVLRWEVSAAGGHVYRLDRWTGAIRICVEDVSGDYSPVRPRNALCD
jgi:hypothetical protein